jgi:hypothetical protein
MQLRKTKECHLDDFEGGSMWNTPDMEAWMVSQRYKGQTYAQMFVLTTQLPRSGQAAMLLEARKKVRTVINRTDRRWKRAQARKSP